MEKQIGEIKTWKQLIEHPDYKMYFKEPPLSKEEEQSEIWLYQNSDNEQEKQKSADRLLKGKGGLLIYYAKQFVKEASGISPQEAFHAATVGWLSAAKDFDLETSNALSSPGVPKVMGEIRKVLEDYDYLSKEQRKNTKVLKTTIEKFYEENQRMPSNEELAESIGWKKSKVQEITQMSNSITSLDTPSSEEAETTIGHLIKDEEESSFAERYEEQDDNLQKLTQLFDAIDENEKEIIIFHYFGKENTNALSISQIASELERSEDEIKKIHDTAIGKMKDYAVKNNLHM